MGIIYRIDGPTNLPDQNKIYVGLTTSSLNKRWSNHKVAVKYFMSGKKDLSYCMLLYTSIAKYGIENYTITLVENCDDNIVNERENYWILKLNSLNPNGYNDQSGGSAEYVQSDKTKAKITKGLLAAERVRNDIHKDYPNHVTFTTRKNSSGIITTHGFRVRFSPMKVEKTFMTGIKESLDEPLKKATEYINAVLVDYNDRLPDSESDESVELVPFEKVIKESNLPMYLNTYERTRNGITRYGFYIYHTPSKISKYITVNSKSEVTEELKNKAIAELQIIIDTHNKNTEELNKKLQKLEI